jgi:3-hydroxymyristoyl/3-hydroxydecanoyl-(acyl carrier protein) dehydratase
MTVASWAFLDAMADDAIAIRRSGTALTMRDLRVEASRVKSLVSGAQEPLYIYCEDAGNFLAAVLGVLSAGRDVLLPGHAAPEYLTEVGARTDNLLSDVAVLGIDAIHVSVGRALPKSAVSDLSPRESSTIGFFTSGSTGQPKTCIKSQHQILAEAAMQLGLWGAPEGPVIGTVSHQHIYGLLFRVFWPLMAGRAIEGQRQEMWEDVSFHARPGCVFISSPAHLSRIPPQLDLAHAPIHIFSSGGPLSLAAAQDALAKLGQTPVEVLGSTETGGVAWRRQKNEGTLWTPLPQVEIKVDEEGALSVRSPFTGEPGFVVMGDRVEQQEDGRFALYARLDRIVKIEGKRVSLPRVEDALRNLDGVVDASSIDLPDRGGALGAIVVLDPLRVEELQVSGPFRFSRQMRRALAGRLEPMELPRLWRFVTRVPENAQGKRTAADLRAAFAQLSDDLPIILARDIGEATAQISMELNPGLRWFDGHFPEQPILPGVAQLHIASLLAEEIWGFVATGSDMARVKFRKIMQPGDKVMLSLSRNGSDRLDFRYLIDDEVMASGAIKGLEK